MEQTANEQEFKYSKFELLPMVKRVEIIGHSGKVGDAGYGRAYVKTDAKTVEISFQDNNSTLKIFIT